MRPPFDVNLPKRPPWPWIAIVASVLLHSLLLFGWVDGRIPDLPRFPRSADRALRPSSGTGTRPARYQTFPSPGERGAQAASRRPGGALSGDRVTVPSSRLGRRSRCCPHPSPIRSPQVLADTGRPAQPAQVGRIGPGLAEGRLWVRPLPLPAAGAGPTAHQEPRPAGGQRGHRRSCSSISTRSITTRPARTRGCRAGPLELAGKKFGLDAKHIYIAGLKIPAAVLALLPIPAGNIDQNRAYNHLMDIRSDIMYAAQTRRYHGGVQTGDQGNSGAKREGTRVREESAHRAAAGKAAYAIDAVSSNRLPKTHPPIPTSPPAPDPPPPRHLHR